MSTLGNLPGAVLEPRRFHFGQAHGLGIGKRDSNRIGRGLVPPGHRLVVQLPRLRLLAIPPWRLRSLRCLGLFHRRSRLRDAQSNQSGKQVLSKAPLLVALTVADLFGGEPRPTECPRQPRRRMQPTQSQTSLHEPDVPHTSRVGGGGPASTGPPGCKQSEGTYRKIHPFVLFLWC